MKVFPRIKKRLTKNLYLAEDKRAKKEGTLENPGGGGYNFLLHEEPNQRNIRKKNNRRERGLRLAPSTKTAANG